MNNPTQEVLNILKEEPNKNAPQSVEPMVERFSLGTHMFECVKEDKKTKNVSVASMLNIMMVALANSKDEGIKEVLTKSNIYIPDVNGRQFFPPVQD